jgi:hypothetical protein
MGQVARQAFFIELAEHATDACMGVLHIVDRVFVGAGSGQLQVEIHVLIGLAHDVEEARRVLADLIAQLAERHEFAGTGGHLHLFFPR